MYYRRKVILSLLELLGDSIEKLQLQKLLFLVSNRMEKPAYDFVPYKFGCYSFSAKADLDTMVKRGQLIESKSSYSINVDSKYFSSLLPLDKEVIRNTVMTFGSMQTNNLIKHTYINYPFFSTKSRIAKDVLNREYYLQVLKHKPNQSEITLFTIGYEGVSLEKYFQKLLRNNVAMLIDVRKNPISMKYGFSKSTLKWVCDHLDIEYRHIPEVGINSDKRQTLHGQADYDILFNDYKVSTLSKTEKYQEEIFELLKQKGRIALTCFEAETSKCHRTHLANAITQIPEYKYDLKHL